MKSYEVKMSRKIHSTVYATVVVDAKDEAEAEDKAIRAGDAVWSQTMITPSVYETPEVISIDPVVDYEDEEE